MKELKLTKQELEKIVGKKTKRLQDKVNELEKNRATLLNMMSEFGEEYNKLKTLDDMKSEFIEVISHQLRTPLTSLRWNLEMLMSNNPSQIKAANQKSSLSAVYTGVINMNEIINDMISVMMIEKSDEIMLKKEIISLSNLLRSVIEDKNLLFQKNKLKVIFAPGKKKWKVIADRDRLQRVLDIIIANAAKYSRIDTEIQVKLEESHKGDKKYINISVTDQGIGIPEDQRRKIFEKFFRADNSPTHAPDGLGLGLYIARKFVEAHDGMIWFDSEEGKGTTFFISLPAGK